MDWRKISPVDVDRVIRDTDLEVLQSLVETLTFSDIELEDLRYLSEANFVKLFRLSQLVIEYLLHTQEFLANARSVAEEDLEEAVGELEKLHTMLMKKTEESSILKKEVKRQKKMITTFETMAGFAPEALMKNFGGPQQQQQLVNKKGYVCPHCSRVFRDSNFLEGHIQRRHPEKAAKQNAEMAKSFGELPVGFAVENAPVQIDAAAILSDPVFSSFKEELKQETERLKGIHKELKRATEEESDILQRLHEEEGKLQKLLQVDHVEALQQEFAKIETSLKKELKGHMFELAALRVEAEPDVQFSSTQTSGVRAGNATSRHITLGGISSSDLAEHSDKMEKRISEVVEQRQETMKRIILDHLEALKFSTEERNRETSEEAMRHMELQRHMLEKIQADLEDQRKDLTQQRMEISEREQKLKELTEELKMQQERQSEELLRMTKDVLTKQQLRTDAKSAFGGTDGEEKGSGSAVNVRELKRREAELERRERELEQREESVQSLETKAIRMLEHAQTAQEEVHAKLVQTLSQAMSGSPAAPPSLKISTKKTVVNSGPEGEDVSKRQSKRVSVMSSSSPITALAEQEEGQAAAGEESGEKKKQLSQRMKQSIIAKIKKEEPVAPPPLPPPPQELEHNSEHDDWSEEKEEEKKPPIPAPPPPIVEQQKRKKKENPVPLPTRPFLTSKHAHTTASLDTQKQSAVSGVAQWMGKEGLSESSKLGKRDYNQLMKVLEQQRSSQPAEVQEAREQILERLEDLMNQNYPPDDDEESESLYKNHFVSWERGTPAQPPAAVVQPKHTRSASAPPVPSGGGVGPTAKAKLARTPSLQPRLPSDENTGSVPSSPSSSAAQTVAAKKPGFFGRMFGKKDKNPPAPPLLTAKPPPPVDPSTATSVISATNVAQAGSRALSPKSKKEKRKSQSPKSGKPALVSSGVAAAVAKKMPTTTTPQPESEDDEQNSTAPVTAISNSGKSKNVTSGKNDMSSVKPPPPPQQPLATKASTLIKQKAPVHNSFDDPTESDIPEIGSESEVEEEPASPPKPSKIEKVKPAQLQKSKVTLNDRLQTNEWDNDEGEEDEEDRPTQIRQYGSPQAIGSKSKIKAFSNDEDEDDIQVIESDQDEESESRSPPPALSRSSNFSSRGNLGVGSGKTRGGVGVSSASLVAKSDDSVDQYVRDMDDDRSQSRWSSNQPSKIAAASGGDVIQSFTSDGLDTEDI